MPGISGGKFVVLGGASQVGSHIGEQLLAAGAREIVLLDNLWLGSTNSIEHLLADGHANTRSSPGQRPKNSIRQVLDRKV